MNTLENDSLSEIRTKFVSTFFRLLQSHFLWPFFFFFSIFATIRNFQLIEYNMRNIFLKKSYIKCGEKLFPESVLKKSRLSISLNQYSKVLYSLFLLYAKLSPIEIY